MNKFNKVENRSNRSRRCAQRMPHLSRGFLNSLSSDDDPISEQFVRCIVVRIHCARRTIGIRDTVKSVRLTNYVYLSW